MDRSFHETRYLKDLVLVNLDLIQRQQELLTEKDKRIQHLQHENESLKCRLDRIERRMSLCSQKQAQQPADDASAQAQATEHIKSASKKKDVVSVQSFESSGQASGTASKHGLPAKSSKLSETTTGKRNTSSTKNGSSVKQGQATAGSLRSKSLVSKPRFGQDNSEILTSDVLYYSSAHSVPEHELMDGTEVLVPSWRVNVVHSKYVMEGTENLNDSTYLKRHQKSEVEEKRRKRWDMQRLRDLHLLQKQHQQNATRSDGRDQTQEPFSFLPSNDRVCYIDISDCIPVAVFGHTLPRISSEDFELPWPESGTSVVTTDSRKVKKRKKNN